MLSIFWYKWSRFRRKNAVTIIIASFVATNLVIESLSKPNPSDDTVQPHTNVLARVKNVASETILGTSPLQPAIVKQVEAPFGVDVAALELKNSPPVRAASIRKLDSNEFKRDVRRSIQINSPIESVNKSHSEIKENYYKKARDVKDNLEEVAEDGNVDDGDRNVLNIGDNVNAGDGNVELPGMLDRNVLDIPGDINFNDDDRNGELPGMLDRNVLDIPGDVNANDDDRNGELPGDLDNNKQNFNRPQFNIDDIVPLNDPVAEIDDLGVNLEAPVDFEKNDNILENNLPIVGNEDVKILAADQIAPPINLDAKDNNNLEYVLALAINMGENFDADKRQKLGEGEYVDRDEAFDPNSLLEHAKQNRKLYRGKLHLKEQNKTMSLQMQAKKMIRLWKNEGRPQANYNCTGYEIEANRQRQILPFFAGQRAKNQGSVHQYMQHAGVANIKHDEVDIVKRDVQDVIRRGSPVKNNVDVTLTAQLNLDRLTNFAKIAANWPGPISAAMYLTQEDADRLDSVIANQSSLANRTNIDYHVVLAEGALYPTNVLRNVALNNSRTQFIFNTDVDFVTAPDTYFKLKKLAEQGLPRSMETYVIPAFEMFVSDVEFPKTKEDAKERIRSLKMLPFHLVNYAPGHLPTQFDKWVNANESYEIVYKEDFEPYIMARVSELPLFHASLVGRYKNKSSHAFAMHKMGYKFIVLPDVFTVHLPHPVKRKRLAYDMCAKNVYRQYKDSLLLKYYQENILQNFNINPENLKIN